MLLHSPSCFHALYSFTGSLFQILNFLTLAADAGDYGGGVEDGNREVQDFLLNTGVVEEGHMVVQDFLGVGVVLDIRSSCKSPSRRVKILENRNNKKNL